MVFSGLRELVGLPIEELSSSSKFPWGPQGSEEILSEGRPRRATGGAVLSCGGVGNRPHLSTKPVDNPVEKPPSRPQALKK